MACRGFGWPLKKTETTLTVKKQKTVSIASHAGYTVADKATAAAAA